MPPELQTLLDNLPCMAYRRLFDEHHTLLYASGGCLELTGYAPEALLNNDTISYMALIVPEDRPAVRQELEAALHRKQPYRFFYRITTANREQRWVVDRGAVVLASDGTAKALEGFVTDNTEGMAVLDSLERRIADRTRKLSAL
jgi:PAS domain S-box-containing protein